MTHVADTHALAWFLEGNRRLSQAARDVFRDGTAEIVIPTIVLAEIKFLYSRGRIRVDLPTAQSHIANSPNLRIHALDEAVIELLPTTLDIHDGLIVATALWFRDVMGETVAVITKDAQITSSGLVQVVW